MTWMRPLSPDILTARLTHALLIAAAALSLGSCGRPSPPRSRNEIIREQAMLSRLYLTHDSWTRVIAPGDSGVFIDKGTGEICSPALMCANPNCPGRTGDEPFVFIAPDPCYFIEADGTLGYDPDRATEAESMLGYCPECLAARRPEAETDAQRQQYVNWVQPYVLPKATERMRELDEELRQREEDIRRRRAGEE